MKKNALVLITLLCTATFAQDLPSPEQPLTGQQATRVRGNRPARSYFPPKDAGHGEIKLGLAFGTLAEKSNYLDLNLDARYTIIDGLEASLILPFPLMLSFDGNSVDGYAGMGTPVIGVRYWLPMGFGFFVDAMLPVDNHNDVEPPMVLGFGAQYSMHFTDEFSFGSEIGLKMPFKRNDHKEGMDLGIGLELNYSLGMVTPYLGVDMVFGITKPTMELSGQKIKSDAAPMGLDLLGGAAFDINKMFGASVDLGFGLGDRYGDTPIAIGASFSLNF
jgi:hypothetical protein